MQKNKGVLRRDKSLGNQGCLGICIVEGGRGGIRGLTHKRHIAETTPKVTAHILKSEKSEN